MASILSTAGLGLVSYRKSDMKGSSMSQSGIRRYPLFSNPSPIGFHGKGARSRSLLVVKAEGQSINPEIRKSEEKVVDSVVVTELSKPLTAYCRCWRSRTFPLCDGSHVKHNKANDDNVGPLLLKKQ